jgi:Na+-translocating ferredoxin:NAD+ oxidoreductase RnfG subunit
MRLLNLLIVSIFCAAPVAAQSISQKAESAMRRVFGAECEQKTVKLDIPADIVDHVQKRSGEAVATKAIVHESLKNGRIVGYGIVDDVRGKAQPITYITLFKPDGEITDVEVLVYREPYGGEIQYESFRKQFRGKRATSKLHIGSDIQNIAGATISSKAITTGTKKIAILLDELLKEKKL